MDAYLSESNAQVVLLGGRVVERESVETVTVERIEGLSRCVESFNEIALGPPGLERGSNAQMKALVGERPGSWVRAERTCW